MSEVADDPAYRNDVTPLLGAIVPPPAAAPVVELGCGEGRVLRDLTEAGFRTIGCDISHSLLRRAVRDRPVVRCRLPALDWLRDQSVGGVAAVLVLEHLADLEPLMRETHRVVEAGGFFAAVLNHPAFTAPGAGPIVDASDGELLWRWGPYFEPAQTEEPAGEGRAVFHHRPLGHLLEAAARAGWALARFEERPLGVATIDANPLLAGQDQLPRLLGVCWRR